MNRRLFIRNASKAGVGTLALGAGISLLESCGSSAKSAASGSSKSVYANAPTMQQRPLPYTYKALEPYIDAATMQIHYTKHASAYTKNMNEAIAAESAGGSLEDILSKISAYSDKLRNNAGGHYNHESFWSWMSPNPAPMSTELTSALEAGFNSVSNMKNTFTDAAMKRFGSGWSWLILNANKQLAIVSTPNQDNPLMDVAAEKGYPLLGLDVWEHAYYLKYQNKRADYINAWWNVVNWQEVENRYNFALKS